MKKLTITALTVVLGTSAYAGDFSFNYENEELLSDQSMSALHTRLEREARSYCTDRYRTIRDLSATSSCVREVVAAAIESIDSEELVAHVEKSGKPVS